MKDLPSELRGLVALDWIAGTFAAATMNEAADEIDRLREEVAKRQRLAGSLSSDGGRAG